MTPNPFIYDTNKPLPVFKLPSTLSFAMLAVSAQLRWKDALEDCERDGRDYTEIHFYRHPETDEFVITYWEIEP